MISPLRRIHHAIESFILSEEMIRMLGPIDSGDGQHNDFEFHLDDFTCSGWCFVCQRRRTIKVRNV